MKIIACDDDKKQRNALLALLNEYVDKAGNPPEVTSYGNAFDVVSALERESFDLALLDILMPGYTGMEAAKEIRMKNKDVRLVFLTSSSEFAVESYRVNAYDYLMKPVDRKVLYDLLNRVDLELESDGELLHVVTSKEVYSIPYEQIESVEVIHRTLIFHLIDKSTHEIYGRLADYDRMLSERPEFIKPHRSYLVNMNNIQSIDPKEIIMVSGSHIPIARGSAKDVRDAYMDHLF